MRFSVFYLNNPIFGITLDANSHARVSSCLYAEDAPAAFGKLEQENISDDVAGGIVHRSLRRFSSGPGDILVSENGDVIRKTHAGLETLGTSVHTLRLLRQANAVGSPGWKRLLERCSFSTLKEAYGELAEEDSFSPEEDLPF